MNHYSIGDVSRRLRISRDTLRFYEKKGIIHPQKLENGYRSYSYEDTRTLLDILFYRRLDFSIEDIKRILHQSSYSSYNSMIQKKIEEEQKQVEAHQRALIHLKYLRQLYKNVEDFTGNYDVRPLRRYYKLNNSNLIDKLEIFDLCYIYQEFHIGRDAASQVDEYYLFAADTAIIMNLEKELEGRLFIQHERCVYTVIAAKNRIPEADEIFQAAKWAREQGYTLTGTAYSGFLLSCAKDDRLYKEAEAENESEPSRVYYIELYLPIAD